MLQWRRRWRKKGGGQPCSRGRHRGKHTWRGQREKTESKSESEVVWSCRGRSQHRQQARSSQGLHSQPASPRQVPKPNFMRRRFLLQTIPSTHLTCYCCWIWPDNHLSDIDPSPVRATADPPNPRFEAVRLHVGRDIQYPSSLPTQGSALPSVWADRYV
jgi:hypothetical protein